MGTFLLSVIIIIGFTTIIILLSKKSNNTNDTEIANLKVDLRKSEDEVTRLTESGRLFFAKQKELESDLRSSNKEREQLQAKLTKLEADEKQRIREQEGKIGDLEVSRKTFEDEQRRIRREDEDKIRLQEEERDGMWNNHESVSLASMKEVCQKPEYDFSFFDNTNLPATFDGTFKPDFLVEFLGQYVIFDAKTTRSTNLQNYINDQAKSIVKKIKSASNLDEIYKAVYFIIPTSEISTLKKTHFYEGGYSIYIISIESFAPILASYKKVLEYDIADENFDPKERETIVDLIAKYDWHISKQNAVSILMAEEGINAMDGKSELVDKMRDDVEIKKGKMRLDNIKPNDLKRLVRSVDDQKTDIKHLKEPSEVKITKIDLKDAKKIVDDVEIN